MGNCGSSLDCDECFSRYSKSGQVCGHEKTINADIAGIGILISFYFSALAVFAVVIWGYLSETLPAGLLQPIDQHLIISLKNLFKRKQHYNSAENPILVQTRKQQSRSHALVAFIKMLSDQQLITGLSILIAALSSRCVISQYEWHIVTSLAYFSATTHSLSLDVLRDYLIQHAWVRYCRITFTLVFLVFFTFAFVVDHVTWAGYGPENWIVQCVLLAWGPDKLLSDSATIIFEIVPVLTILWGKHISAMTRIAAPKATYYRHATTTMMGGLSVRFWSLTNNLTLSDSAEIVADAHIHYNTEISPSNGNARISIWYFLEQYHEAYLSELPVWAFQFVYGTTNTIRAVWRTNIDLSSDNGYLGFGQIVAIGLLVLPLLSLVEIINEQSVSDNHTPSKARQDLHPPNVSAKSLPSRTTPETLVHASEFTQTGNVSQQSEGDADRLQSRVARKVAILSLVVCVLATVVMILAGSLPDDAQLWLLPAIVVIWAASKIVITMKRQISQARFVRKEIILRKTKKTSLQSPPAAHGTSDASALLVTPRLPSIDIPVNQQERGHTTATDTSPTFERPRRYDTEASLGLNSLFNRQDEIS